MRKAARVVLVLVVTLLLLVAAVVALLESPWATSVVESRLSKRFDGRAAEVGDIQIDWGLQPEVRVSDIVVDNPAWAPHQRMLKLQAFEARVGLPALLQGTLHLKRVELEQPVLHLARRADGSDNWTQPEGEGGGLEVQVRQIFISGGELTYADPHRSTRLRANVETTRAAQGEGARRLALNISGKLRGEPLQLQVSGGAPTQLEESAQRYPLRLDGRLGTTQLQFVGTAQQPLQLEGVQGQFSARGPRPGPLADLLGLPDLAQAPFQAQGRLGHHGKAWSFESFRIELGQSEVGGDLRIDPEQRELALDLHADTLDLDALGLMPDDGEAPSRAQPVRPPRGTVPQQTPSAVTAQSWDTRLTQWLAPLADWQGPIDITARGVLYDDQALYNLDLQGALQEDTLVVDQLQFAAGGGALAANGWLKMLPHTLRGGWDVALQPMDLGAVLGPFGYPELGILGGHLHLRTTEEALLVRDTELVYRQPKQDLVLHVSAETGSVARKDDPRIHLEGWGRRNQRPFKFDLTGGPLLDLDEPDKPYPVEGDLYSLDTSVHIEGTVTQPLRWKAADLTLWAQGPNPADLYSLTGLPFPQLPPYELRGRLRFSEGRIQLQDARGSFGDSDLSGDIRIEPGQHPKVWATLASERLDFDDLWPVMGVPPRAGEAETATPAQQRAKRRREERSGVLPGAPLDLERLRDVDAVVRFRGREVLAPNLPLSDLSMELELHDGRLIVAPLEFGIGQGEVNVALTLHAARRPVQGRVDLTVERVDLKQVVREFGLAEDSYGHLGGRGELRFTGHSVADAAATTDGHLELVMEGGRLDMFAVEMAGLDLGEALVARLTEDETVPIQCAYARFDAEQGLARLEQFLLATTDSNFTGGGKINLREEHVDLVFESHPKDFSLFTISSPVGLEGSFTDVEVDIISMELLGRGVAAALTGALAPPAALLPLVSPGPGEGAGPGCRGVMEQYRTAEKAD